jgi:acetoacetate decarboxylase
MRLIDFSGHYSMPFGSPMYGEPPYVYRGVQDMVIAFEADAAPIAPLLPPGVTIDGSVADCLTWMRWIPFSAFGQYHEAFIMVRVMHGGKPYLYNPVMLVDNEVALAVGREVWGYPKKIGKFTRSWGNSAAGFGEQLFFQTERPAGQPVITATMACLKRANPEDMGADCPFLSFRLIPSAEDVTKPCVAELIMLELPAQLHTGPDGNPEFYTGPAQLKLKGGASDPWHLMSPTKVKAGYFGVSDFDLVPGKVVHDYLAN